MPNSELGYSLSLHFRDATNPSWFKIDDPTGLTLVVINLDPFTRLVINNLEQLEALSEIVQQAYAAFIQGIE